MITQPIKHLNVFRLKLFRANVQTRELIKSLNSINQRFQSFLHMASLDCSFHFARFLVLLYHILILRFLTEIADDSVKLLIKQFGLLLDRLACWCLLAALFG